MSGYIEYSPISWQEFPKLTFLDLTETATTDDGLAHLFRRETSAISR